ncbi:MAG: type III-A CRISPR-associated protein Cas10/Csm1 [Parasporobacterium sp.]|nr:type III-A CRISPR-associated protein Cas10/Csm1 [Parasporobacterium sp.]
MNETDVKVIIGGLLHDIGKVVYRTGDKQNHSASGAKFIREELGIEDQEIIDSVLYHHKSALVNADIREDSTAYITYIADNIASATDRRKKETEDYGFEMSLPLQPVFNILNGNHEEMYYHPDMVTREINFPMKEKIPFTSGFYQNVMRILGDALKAVEWNEAYVNSILSAFEQTCSYVPSSTSKGEVADISLYDHIKLTGAFNSCIYQYLKEHGITDYRKELLENEAEFFAKPVALLYEIDLSGIQDFIYTIHTKDALKMLRARSFYLEILMEHVEDMLLERLSLSRANIMYSGGGHSYMFLPNTGDVKQVLDQFGHEINDWLRETFDVSLYMAYGYTEASPDALRNNPEGSYKELFRNVGKEISKRKENRYTAEEIIHLNTVSASSYEHECKVCKKLSSVDEDDLCPICSALKASSKDILYQPFFTIMKNAAAGLPLPGGYSLVAESEESLRKRMGEDSSFVRAYAKNNYYTGLNVASKLWVANYTTGQTFEELSERAEGIHRLAVLRADVDNLGKTFVQGFEEQYSTVSRTATLSRHLSLFFKYYINGILEKGNMSLSEPKGNGRNVSIVYSGGDDLFLVGAWNEVIEAALDIRNAFHKYTQGTLTISSGIGIFQSGYPISQMALDSGILEDDSKDYPGKNAVTLFPDGGYYKRDGKTLNDSTYPWDEFEQKVVEEKYRLLRSYFMASGERGNSFLYHLLELIRNCDNKINFARYVYLLSRMEPDQKADPDEKKLFREFSKNMYDWIQNETDRRELKTAIYIYAYINREETL